MVRGRGCVFNSNTPFKKSNTVRVFENRGQSHKEYSSLPLARKQEIIKVTEQLIEAINNGDFEAYT